MVSVEFCVREGDISGKTVTEIVQRVVSAMKNPRVEGRTLDSVIALRTFLNPTISAGSV